MTDVKLVEKIYSCVICLYLQKLKFYIQRLLIIINVILESGILQCDSWGSDRGLAHCEVCTKCSCVECDVGLCGEQECLMKSMPVTYVHDMLQENAPTMRKQWRLSPGHTGKDLKLTIYFHLVLLL
jgi:hypothetical protein